MQNLVKRASAGAMVGGALLAAGGLSLAHAAPPAQSVVGDGKVNVTVTAGGQQVGTLQDVSLTSAGALVASACPNAGITTEALQALDVDSTPVPGTCAGVGLTFTFVQNGPGNSENAPGQNPASTTPSSSTTTPATTTSR